MGRPGGPRGVGPPATDPRTAGPATGPPGLSLAGGPLPVGSRDPATVPRAAGRRARGRAGGSPARTPRGEGPTAARSTAGHGRERATAATGPGAGHPPPGGLLAGGPVDRSRPASATAPIAGTFLDRTIVDDPAVRRVTSRALDGPLDVHRPRSSAPAG
jgi:hypothetical protein